MQYHLTSKCYINAVWSNGRARKRCNINRTAASTVSGRAYCLLKICRRPDVTSMASAVARLKTRKLHSRFWPRGEFTVSTQSKPGINCMSRAVPAFSEYLQEVLLKDTGPLCAPDNLQARSLA